MKKKTLKVIKSKKAKLIFFISFCILISFIALLVCSKCSFLYVFNDWVDGNAFFTTGKGMMNGKIVYKDIFEHKGPTLYLIYGIGYLLSNASFRGVFILEVISFSIFLYFIGKVIDLYLARKEVKYLILPILTALILTSNCFVQGGSAEEFCFPFFAISLYYFLKFLKDGILTNRAILINGIIAGIILTIKFTLLGFWFGFCLSLVIYNLIKRDIKGMIKFLFYFLVGMAIPLLLWCIYFLVGNGVKDFIKVYFIMNLTVYSKDSTSIIQGLISCYTNFFRELLNNGLSILILFSITLLFMNNKINKNINRLYLFICIFFSIFFTYIGGTYFIYYLLIIIPWIILGLIELFSWFEELLSKMNNKVFTLLKIVFCFVFYIIFIYACYNGANYKQDMKLKKEDDYHFIFADIINKEKGATFLNYGALDFGLYTSANIVPNVKYFHMPNLPYDKYPYVVDAHIKYLQEKTTTYILYRDFLNEEVNIDILNNYEVVKQHNQYYEGNEFTYFLLKSKD